MEFFELYGRHLGELIAWLSKPETSIPAIKLIQALAALLGATVSVLGFYKAWKFAEKRLGKRLDEFLDKQELTLTAARRKLKEVRDQRADEQVDIADLLTRRELKAVLKSFGRRFRAPAKAALEEAIARTEERSRIAHKKEELHLKERALAHLLLGTIADADQDHQAALIHFQSALELNPDDAEALEYVGVQYLKLGNATEALGAFGKLEEFARHRGNALLQAQANRYCGTAFEKLPTPRLGHANGAYGAAIAIFPHDGPQIELARIYECRALVSMELGFRRQANECLMHALARYAEHERLQKRRPSDRSGTTRILAALKRLEALNGATPLGSASNAHDGPTTPAELPLALNTLSEQQAAQQPPDDERPN